MILRLDLPPAMAKKLSAESARAGLPLPQYALRLLSGCGAGPDQPDAASEDRREPCAAVDEAYQGEPEVGVDGGWEVREGGEPYKSWWAEVRQDRVLHVRNFRSDAYRLTDDLVVSLREEGDVWIATSFDTGQYGYGASPEDAIEHLCTVVEEYYEILKEERDNLGRQLQGHLRYLDSILARF